ncbi:alpha/beta fold hydrolase [Undibacterium sp. TJN25]|uniref:alpha/beta fold hydrolase n=1 Tax=Undibacterium sp. TJN25 TaxID=3413056 RepID=UPI003BF213AE
MKSIFQKLHLMGTLMLAATSLVLSGCTSGNAQTVPVPATTPAPQLAANTTAVLVHGAWADGSSWSSVIPLLQQAGLKVVAVQLPRASLADDAATVKRTIDLQTGPVILVGHSYGGSVITEAGGNAKVAALVYVSAFAPDAGQSVNDITDPFPAPDWKNKIIADEGGYLTLPTDIVTNVFAADVPKDKALQMAATQGPLFNQCFGDKVSVPAWKTKASWWLIGGQDQIIPPALQQAMAQHIGATVSTSPLSSHVVMVSHPDDVAAVIMAAAIKTAAQ